MRRCSCCNIWRQPAENVADSLTRGTRVIVHGRLKQRSFETREGEKRTVIELEVDEIGPSLRYATTKVTKTGRDNRSGSSGAPSEATSGGDSWESAGATVGAGYDEEPPF